MVQPKAAAVAVKKSTIAVGKGAASVPGKAVDEVHYNGERVCCGGWCTRWAATDEQRPYWPPRHSGEVWGRRDDVISKAGVFQRHTGSLWRVCEGNLQRIG
jgi:hypothetical protein